MGHDIYAYKRQYRTHDARELAYERIVPEGDESPDDWSMRYDCYRAETEVAYFRRSMRYGSSPVGPALYTALGAEKHYGGVSGQGTEQVYTVAELNEALSVFDAVMKSAQQIAIAHPEYAEALNGCVTDEIEFVTKARDYALTDPEGTVLIYFG